MKTRWLVSALLAGGIVVGIRSGGCLSSNPEADQRLAAHFGELCEIARDNVDTPVDGVRGLGRYFSKHLGDMYGAWGGAIATIERIDDDAAHDERARVTRDRLRAPLRACQRDWKRFFDAVHDDDEATALVQRATDRLGRTFDIIVDGKLGDLPLQLELRLEALAR